MGESSQSYEPLRRRLGELVAALEGGDPDAQALEGVLHSVRLEFERVHSRALGQPGASAGQRELCESAAREVQRLVAVALDLAARRRDEAAQELSRTRAAQQRLGFYRDAATGDSCDVAG